MALKVAVVGLAENSRHLIPWNIEGWEVWGLAWDPMRYYMHRTFEMHDWPLLTEHSKPSYVASLKDLPNLYTSDGMAENSIRYPVEDVIRSIGVDYFCSSVSYMLALALHDGAEEIGVYGVNGDDEYGYQKPNIEYLIGLARGRGVKVTIPDVSTLCRYVDPPTFSYDRRYGKKK